MNIYSCIDYQNIEKIYILYYSVFKNSKNFDKLKFHIITDKHPNVKDIPLFLKGKIKFGILNFDSYWTNLINNFNNNFYKRASWCKSNLNFSRFFIFNLFPNENRFIYLDWDMIVQKDIYELDKYYLMEDLIVANLKDEENILKNIINERKNYNRNLLNKIQNEFGSNIFEKSFNSGFYIVSRKHFILNNINKLIKSLIDFQKKYDIFKFGTQVIMNLLLINKTFIDYKWNTNEINKKSNIIHWCGKKKPWDNEDEIWFTYYNSFKTNKY
jgi:lipopolysaccharide biosynthesis glycosyltransferase